MIRTEIEKPYIGMSRNYTITTESGSSLMAAINHDNAQFSICNSVGSSMSIELTPGELREFISRVKRSECS